MRQDMGNGILRISNVRKTYYYLKKNGVKNAAYAAIERVMTERTQSYHYQAPSEAEIRHQQQESGRYPYLFSILVPAYETAEKHLREMLDSVCAQSYAKWELIVADASRTRCVKEVVDTYEDNRIRYLQLQDNRGISENTNAALRAARGDYIGLLDHDDVLTPDALYEMASAIGLGERNGRVWMLYSDEDKGNGDLTSFYEPHYKTDFNIDLLLSNNYICHFLVMKSELMKELGFRPEYDGAQDYDLVLRAAGRLVYEGKNTGEAAAGGILHISRVLYHWRCHTHSTAENPESKRYAYDAGRHALEAFLKERGWKGTVHDTKHLGFYRIDYEQDIFAQRGEVGVIGGRLLDRQGRIAGGIYDEAGKCPYRGLHRNFSGYMHRGTLMQEAYAVDVRCMRVREEVMPLYDEVFGQALLTDEGEAVRLSMEFGRRVREAGYRVVWNPYMEAKISLQ